LFFDVFKTNNGTGALQSTDVQSAPFHPETKHEVPPGDKYSPEADGESVRRSIFPHPHPLPGLSLSSRPKTKVLYLASVLSLMTRAPMK